MLQRIRNPNQWNYCYYGGAGITVCSAWLSFKTFLEDMGNRPRRSYTLDRINPLLGYEKENCRWSTRIQQANNRKKDWQQMTGAEQEYAQQVAEAF